MEIDFQKALEHMAIELHKAHLDLAVKNAFIDQQGEKITFLEDKLKQFEPEEKKEENNKTKKEPK